MNGKGYKALKSFIKYVEYNNSLTLLKICKDVFAKITEIELIEMNVEYYL